MKRRYVMVFLVMLCCACAQKQTKVILLPQDDGETGAVTLATPDQNLTLDQPYMVGQSGTMTTTQADAETIEKTYGSLLKMEFKRPRTTLPEPEDPPPLVFNLFFESNTLTLTEASRQQLDEIIALLKKKPPTRLRIAGYTDTVGDRAGNLTLSTRRADCIAQILNRADRQTNRMEIRGYGEHGPMVTTPDNTAEPRNRRVRIYIY